MFSTWAGHRLTTGAVFSPAELFASGEQGAWYDPSDLTSMWQDSAGTTPAAVNSPVGKIDDKSGRGNHLSHATTANKPILRQVGAVYYLEFDGVDDHLFNSAPSFHLYNDGAYTASLAVQGGPPAADRYLFAMGNSASSNPIFGTHRSWAATATSNGPIYRDDAATARLNTISAPLAYSGDKVVTAHDDGSSYTDYVDGTLGATTAYTRAGTYTFNRICLGALMRNTTGSFWAGRFHGGIIRSGAALDASTRASIRTYLAAKQGRTL